MLDSLRKAAGTWVAKLLLMLLVASFAVWGISGQIVGGLTGNSVVTAGETTVSTLEYRLAYDRQLSVLGQRFGQMITREQAVALGVDEQVLAQLVAGAVLDEQAREMGLGLSKQRLAELTAEDPAFQGPDGRFDRGRFDFVLRQVGMRAEDYLKSRSQLAVRQQIADAVAEGVSMPQIFLDALARYRGEDRTVEYLVVPGEAGGPIADPGEDDLQEWYDARKDQYRAPEYRSFTYLLLSAETLADPNSVTSEQARADYERGIARYTKPERRSVQQIVFATREEAEAARARLDGGTSFSEIAAAEGKTESDISLGEVTEDDIADPAIAEAAFALAAGETSPVIDGAFGPVLLRVTDIVPAVVQPFEEVEAELRRELAIHEATSVLTDMFNQYEDLRAGGATLAEAAEALNLELHTVEAVDRAGLRQDGSVTTDLPESRQLLQEVFESDIGIENPAIHIGSSGYLLYEVAEVTPERERSLDEVRDQVVADWKGEEASRLAAETAASIEERLAGGETLAAIAEELSLQTETRYGIRRDSSDAGLGEAGIAAVFDVAVGGTGSVPAPAQENAWIVFHVTESFQQQDSEIPEASRRALDGDLGDDLVEQLVMQLQNRYGVTVNQTAINQALSF